MKWLRIVITAFIIFFLRRFSVVGESEMPRRFLATRLSPSSAERARNALDQELDRPSEFTLNRPASAFHLA